MLADITGTVDQELLLRNEYLVAENQILKIQIKGRLLLSDVEKTTLADDAEAICEAVGRPSMRFVPIKDIEQQDNQPLHRARELLVKQRTALCNQIRGAARRVRVDCFTRRASAAKQVAGVIGGWRERTEFPSAGFILRALRAAGVVRYPCAGAYALTFPYTP